MSILISKIKKDDKAELKKVLLLNPNLAYVVCKKQLWSAVDMIMIIEELHSGACDMFMQELTRWCMALQTLLESMKQYIAFETTHNRKDVDEIFPFVTVEDVNAEGLAALQSFVAKMEATYVI